MNSFHKTKQKSHVESGRKEGLLKLFSKLSAMPSLVFSVYPKSSSISLKKLRRRLCLKAQRSFNVFVNLSSLVY